MTMIKNVNFVNFVLSTESLRNEQYLWIDER